jgi:hypothetical protein
LCYTQDCAANLVMHAYLSVQGQVQVVGEEQVAASTNWVECIREVCQQPAAAAAARRSDGMPLIGSMAGVGCDSKEQRWEEEQHMYALCDCCQVWATTTLCGRCCCILGVT